MQAILNGNFCNQCHTGGGSTLPVSLDLNDVASQTQVVGVASVECSDKLRVVPGHPETSYLLDKLLGSSQQTGGCFDGVQMPQTLPPLSATELATVTSWIAAGARP